MHIFTMIVSIILLALILWDAFESIVLPRRVTRRFRFTRFFYRSTWVPWSWIAKIIRSPKWRDAYLSVYGPLSLLFLLIAWAFGLIFSFALLQWSIGSGIETPEHNPGFISDFYFSGSTFFTLGLGDVTPVTKAARVITVIEAGMGFGFLALVISYLPVLYQAFSKREVNISLLDARAGSPPTAIELLRRHRSHSNMDALNQFLRDWEMWCAELLESHLSYPVLAYYRSQHSNQSWLAALTMILDASALAMVGIDGTPVQQAQLTFAIARHTVVDLSQIFNKPPQPPEIDRLSKDDLIRVRELLAEAGVALHSGDEADRQLLQLRKSYEPYVNALSQFLLIALPPWYVNAIRSDNWQTSAWERSSLRLRTQQDSDDHF
jgi:Ion channel